MIFNVGQGHKQPVVLQETNRCVSHNCSDAKHLLDSIPPCLTPSSTSACSDQDTEVPAHLSHVLGSVKSEVCELRNSQRRGILPEFRVDIPIHGYVRNSSIRNHPPESMAQPSPLRILWKLSISGMREPACRRQPEIHLARACSVDPFRNPPLRPMGIPR